ncbi:MAG TPA: acetolactate synthase [Candidatus Solibacter sp.]|nr:acetolactate synthase [Candidatus Solibacter sp.]
MADDPAYALGPTALRQRREADVRFPYNSGRLLADALKRLGTQNLFTLSGGHLFPLFDGCVASGVRVIDHRHEEAAVHAAEAWAKLTRVPGVAAVTAGPGVTNAATGLAAATFNRSPILVIGGRAPDFRWGQGSLQEYEHIPVMATVAKKAVTVHDGDRVHIAATDLWHEALAGAPGATFMDVPMDVMLTSLEESSVEWPEAPTAPADPDPELIERAAELIDRAERPVVISGTGVHWHHGEEGLRRLAETAGLPVYMNGLGRGTLPADHPNAFSRTRSAALGKADLVILLGTPLDFRLNFGQPPLLSDGYKLIRIDALESDLSHNRTADVGIAGDIGRALELLAERVSGAGDRAGRLQELRDAEAASLAKDRELLESDADPIHPMRLYGEILKALDRDAVVVGDGGDFVSYAGKLIPTYEPGSFIDPGPFGGLGMGAPSAIAARLARPDKQVLLLVGDGAFGFSAMEFDTMVRHRLPVVAVMGNNNAWGLEKHPMEMMFGWSVAADLNPAARYDKLVEALGGHGEYVTRPGEIGPALKRAFDSGLPALVNVACDPAVAYPRSANLA